jgi:Yip1 domain.
MNIVDRAKNIILTPKNEWQVISGEEPDIKQIFTGYVLPLALIPVIAGIIGFTVIGRSGYRSFGMGFTTAIIQLVLAFVGVYITAFVVDLLAPNFGSEKNLGKAVQLVAYSFTPTWVAGVLFIVPALGVLVVLASLYGIYLLYLGLPVMMKTPQDKVVVYLVISIVVLIIVYTVISAVLSSIFFGIFGLGALHMVH